METPQRVLDRIAARSTTNPESGCVETNYSVGSHGYSQVGWHEQGKRFMTLVHRAVWVAANGEIPEGMTIDHICKNRRCCNLEHLRLLSNFENSRRTSGRDWPLGQCINGHSNDHLHFPASGGKAYCNACRTEAQRKRRARKRLEGKEV